MPKRYEAIKAKCLKEGGSEADCAAKAAKIFNATRKPGEPSLVGYHRKVKK